MKRSLSPSEFEPNNKNRHSNTETVTAIDALNPGVILHTATVLNPELEVDVLKRGYEEVSETEALSAKRMCPMVEYQADDEQEDEDDFGIHDLFQEDDEEEGEVAENIDQPAADELTSIEQIARLQASAEDDLGDITVNAQDNAGGGGFVSISHEEKSLRRQAGASLDLTTMMDALPEAKNARDKTASLPLGGFNPVKSSTFISAPTPQSISGLLTPIGAAASSESNKGFMPIRDFFNFRDASGNAAYDSDDSWDYYNGPNF